MATFPLLLIYLVLVVLEMFVVIFYRLVSSARVLVRDAILWLDGVPQ